jgi:hypothetical protein
VPAVPPDRSLARLLCLQCPHTAVLPVYCACSALTPQSCPFTVPAVPPDRNLAAQQVPAVFVVSLSRPINLNWTALKSSVGLQIKLPQLLSAAQ